MKKILLTLTGACFVLVLHAQECITSPRAMTDLPLSSPEGYIGRLAIDIPGNTLLAKADSCLARLYEQFDTELAGIEVSEGIAVDGSVFRSIRYKQLIDDVLVDDHGVYFRFDNQDRLAGIHVNLALDSALQADLEDLAALAIPGKHIIVYTDGEYVIKPKPSTHQHVTCTDAGTADIDMQISFPTYANGCREVLDEISITSNFTSERPLRTVSTNRLCGKYANPISSPTFQNGSGATYWWYDCETTSHKHEALMAYFHLNFAYDYIEDNMVEFGPPIQNVIFDYASDDEANVPYVEITDEGYEIRFSEEPTGGGYNDIAEDADHVAGAAFEGYLVFNGHKVPTGLSHGVGAGTIAYWTWRYMVSLGYSHTNIGGWAGAQHIAISLDNSLNESDLEEINNRADASVWAGALYKIYDEVLALNEPVMQELVLNAALDWGSNDINQWQAAEHLYDLAFMMTPSKISETQLCAIRAILTERYPSRSSYFNPVRDLYIKDTHAGMPIAGGGSTGEDIGTERNEISMGRLDKSPNIWNCVTANCVEHQRPVAGVTNYLNVLVSNEGCDWPSLEQGRLRLFAAFTPLNERWPEDWGGETDKYYYYDGNWVVIGKYIGYVALNNYTTDKNGRLYTLSWTPWNPWSVNKPWTPQLGFLAQITDASEPLFDATPEDDLAFHYVKDNNNVARRKNSISVFAASPYPVPAPVKASAMIGTGGITTAVKLTISYTKPLFLNTAGAFDSLGTISLIFPQNLLDRYGNDLPDEDGFDWINDSTITITSPDFNFPLDADPDSIYQLQIRYAVNGLFQPVSFYLELRDDEDCTYGGEHFTIDPNGTSDREANETHAIEPVAAIYPNPVSGLARIHVSTVAAVQEVRVLDAVGQVIPISFNQVNQHFSTDHLPEGLYFVQMTLTDGRTTTTSFIKLTR